MKALDMDIGSWEDLATDLSSWRDTLTKQLKKGEEKLMFAAEQRTQSANTASNQEPFTIAKYVTPGLDSSVTNDAAPAKRWKLLRILHPWSTLTTLTRCLLIRSLTFGPRLKNVSVQS
jgi:hypothetical protein